MKWKGKLIKQILNELKDDNKWTKLIEKAQEDPRVGIHLAVFNEPYLALIYKGEKKIESRFSINKISPYLKISRGDIVILKSSGGPVTGLFIAGEIKFFSNLSKSKFMDIETKYGKQICAHYDPNFWKDRELTKFVTLIEVKHIKALNPFRIEKKDRSAWSIIRPKNNHLVLNF